jgi:hypothetical protein
MKEATYRVILDKSNRKPLIAIEAGSRMYG